MIALAKLFRVVQKVPTIVWIVGILLVAGKLYVHEREQAAVARAELNRWQDSVTAADKARQARVDSVIGRWQDAVARLEASKREDEQRAQQAATTTRTRSRSLHDLVDTNAVVKDAVDRLETSHAVEVAALGTALARADSIHKEDQKSIVEMRKSLVEANLTIARILDKLDKASKPPSLRKQIIRSIPALVLGIAVGRAL